MGRAPHLASREVHHEPNDEGGASALFAYLQASLAQGSVRPGELQRSTGNNIIHVNSLHMGAPVATGKAVVDTVYLIGGHDSRDGTFENATGEPDWNGWRSVDHTYYGDPHWFVSTHAPLAGARSMVCGADFDTDCGFGYGNSWFEWLLYGYMVPNPAQSYNCHLSAVLRTNCEDLYEFVYAEVYHSGGWSQIGFYTGARVAMVETDFSVSPGNYLGGALRMRWRFVSDSGWSDEDCLYDSDGACHLDDVQITVCGTEVENEDFEDGVADHWRPQVAPGVGNFAQILIGQSEGLQRAGRAGANAR